MRASADLTSAVITGFGAGRRCKPRPVTLTDRITRALIAGFTSRLLNIRFIAFRFIEPVFINPVFTNPRLINPGRGAA
jgi:hypothetical protein